MRFEQFLTARPRVSGDVNYFYIEDYFSSALGIKSLMEEKYTLLMVRRFPLEGDLGIYLIMSENKNTGRRAGVSEPGRNQI